MNCTSSHGAGRALLVFNLVPHGTFEYHAQPGVVRTMVCASDDDGATWTAPRDITGDVVDTASEFGKAAGHQSITARLVDRIVSRLGHNHRKALLASV